MKIETSEVTSPSRQQIAALAYQFYLQRGRQGGNEVEDWLRAERQLTAPKTAPKTQNSNLEPEPAPSHATSTRNRRGARSLLATNGVS